MSKTITFVNYLKEGKASKGKKVMESILSDKINVVVSERKQELANDMTEQHELDPEGLEILAQLYEDIENGISVSDECDICLHESCVCDDLEEEVPEDEASKKAAKAREKIGKNGETGENAKNQKVDEAAKIPEDEASKKAAKAREKIGKDGKTGEESSNQKVDEAAKIPEDEASKKAEKARMKIGKDGKTGEDGPKEKMMEKKIVKRVSATGKIRKKIVCGPGKKLVNGACVVQSGAEKVAKRRSTKKRLKTLRAKGAGAQRIATRKRNKALKKRKALGFKSQKG